LPIVDRDMLASSQDDFVLRAETKSIQRSGSGRQLTAIFFDKLLRGIKFSEEQLRDEYEVVHTLESRGGTSAPRAVGLTRRGLAGLAEQSMRCLAVARVVRSDIRLNLLEPFLSG